MVVVKIQLHEATPSVGKLSEPHEMAMKRQLTLFDCTSQSSVKNDALK